MKDGLGLGSIVFLLLLTFKLAEIGQVADWSWWAVTSPLWAPWALLVAGLVCVVVVAAVADAFFPGPPETPRQDRRPGPRRERGA